MNQTWVPQPTEDGSFTFFSEEFNEAFHSRHGAKSEAFAKFAQVTDLVTLATQDTIHLLDVCYGLGYNTAAALDVIWATNPDCQVHWVGLELDATVPIAAISPDFLQLWSVPVQEVVTAIAQTQHHQTPTLTATLHIGDARETIQTLAASGFQADAIFFDPFSPRRCPQLWTVEFFTWVARCLTPTGKLATYSRSASVRSAMVAAGLRIGTIPLGDQHLPHEWAQGTVASFNGRSLHALSQMEQEHLQTRAAIPYRDPDLRDSAETIQARHQQEQQRSQRESTSSWRRRWGIE